MLALREASCFVTKVQAGAVKTEHGFIQLAAPGHPDLLCALPDKTWGCIECKKPGAYLSYIQRLMLRKINEMGLRWAVLDDASQVDTWLADKKYHGPDRYVKQVFTDPEIRETKPVIPTGLTGTPYEGLKQVAEAKRRAFEESIGEAPF